MYKNKLAWYTTIQMKYLQVMVKLIKKIRECNHTISQFPTLAIAKSSEAQKMREGRQGQNKNRPSVAPIMSTMLMHFSGTRMEPRLPPLDLPCLAVIDLLCTSLVASVNN